MRWVGIDEAGYGPNLGPLVMTAVMAEALSEYAAKLARRKALDFWGDLRATVDRAGGDPGRLWVDDSKAIFAGSNGRIRLEMTCRAAIDAAASTSPGTLGALFDVVGAGTLADVELALWLEPQHATGDGPPIAWVSAPDEVFERKPLHPECGSWRLAEVRSVVVGPALFNQRLDNHGVKSGVHFEAFEKLLAWVWERTPEGSSTRVVGDKHGGRHYYYGPLVQAFPDTWIDRGPEGPELSRYTLRAGSRRMELSLAPKADGNDGLVALASIVSKTIRELWMDVFNRYWCSRVPGLRPCAGYPNDSARFRVAIETAAAAEQCDPAVWWRLK